MGINRPKEIWSVKFLLPHGEVGEIVTRATGIFDAIKVALDDFEFTSGKNTGVLITEVRTYPENKTLWWWEENSKVFGEDHMAWARIVDNKPVEVAFEDFNGKVHPDLVWIPIPNALVEFVTDKYIVSGSGKNAKVVPPTVQYLVDQLKGQLAKVRWQNQNVPVEYSGNRYLSTRDSINDMVSRIQDGETYEANADNGEGSFIINWKSATGVVALTLVELKAIKSLISTHVQGCFDRETAINEALAVEIGNSKDYAMIIRRYREEQLKGWPDIEDQVLEDEEVFYELRPTTVDDPAPEPEAVEEPVS